MNSTCVEERTRAGDENESDGVRMTRAATATIPILSSLGARIVRTESLAHPADALSVTLRRPCTTSQIARQPDVPDSQRQRASQRGKEQLDNADSDSNVQRTLDFVSEFQTLSVGSGVALEGGYHSGTATAALEDEVASAGVDDMARRSGWIRKAARPKRGNDEGRRGLLLARRRGAGGMHSNSECRQAEWWSLRRQARLERARREAGARLCVLGTGRQLLHVGHGPITFTESERKRRNQRERESERERERLESVVHSLKKRERDRTKEMREPAGG